jgi:hypothetical protein
MIIDVMDVELHIKINKRIREFDSRIYAGCLFELLDGFMNRRDIESLGKRYEKNP